MTIIAMPVIAALRAAVQSTLSLSITLHCRTTMPEE